MTIPMRLSLDFYIGLPMKLGPVHRISRLSVHHSPPRQKIISFHFRKTDRSYHQQRNTLFTKQTVVTTTAPVMASDEAYTSFLEKANQPTGANSSTSKSHNQDQQAAVTSHSSNVPAVLQSLDMTFTSESDEPFEPFTVPYSSSSLPSASEFARAIKHDNGPEVVEELSVGEFDPQNEYKKVIEAVEAAVAREGEGKAAVKCFMAGSGKSTKVVYYVVGLDSKDRRLVGVRAVSVES